MATTPINTDFDFNNASKILNLPNPSGSQDSATKAYVDAAIEGLAWKDSARVASSTNINLASPGATIDGITMVANDRFIAKNQTTASEIGVYIWNGATAQATRSLDMSTAEEVEEAILTVEEGTSNGTSFRQTAVNVTLGTSALAFTIFGTAAPDASESTSGIAEIATQAEVDGLTDNLRFVTPLKLATYVNKKLKYVATVGDGSATSIAVTHSLGTLDVSVYVYETGGSKRQVLCEVRHTDANTITLLFSTAPAASAYRVVIIG